MLYFLGSRWVCTTIFSSFFVFTIRGKKNLNPKFYPCNKKWVIPLRHRLLVTTFASPKENTFNPMHLGPIGAIDHCISRIFTNFSLISNQNLPIKLIRTCNLSVGVWVYSLISSSFLYIYVCVCVSQIKKKKYSVLSSHPTSVKCDIEKGFITCSATLIAACSFGVGMWVYSIISSPFPYIYVCVFLKKKTETCN